MRKSNIELLRIISMLLIVMSHCSVHTDWPHLSISQSIMIDSLSLGEVGVVCFVLITGYFSWNKPLRSKSIVKLVAQVFFYSFCCTLLVGLLTDPSSLSISSFNLFPTLTGAYWFPTTFIGLLLFQPLINKWISHSSKNEHLRALVLCFLAFSVIPFILKGSFIYSNFAYFVFLYLLGSFFGKYPNSTRLSTIQAATGAIISFALYVIATSLVVIFPSVAGRFDIQASTLYGLGSPFVLGMGAFLFILFCRIDIGSHESINAIASTAFGIYLISDNSLMRPLVWHIAENGSFVDGPMLFLFLHMLLSVVAIFAACSTVDYLRIRFIEAPFFKAADNVLRKPLQWIDAKLN